MNQQADLNALITAEEAAKVSGLDEDYIRKLAREGKIIGRKFGNTWMLDEISVRCYAAASASKNAIQRIMEEREENAKRR